jgi:LuxR family transcriptional regulator, maltose regulon positive regulatory protein
MAVADFSLGLVEAKLAPPPIRPGTVAKTDVIAPLCASPLPLATVSAPAGYGKTTLLARWNEADPRPFAWVALDGRDNDAVLFMRYIAAALHRVEPLAPEVFDALSGPGGSNWTTRVPRLGSALAALDRPLVLVLDDLHTLANPSCLDVLAALVEHVPAGSQIAIATREEPALPLGRWRMQGRLHEVGTTDLRLDEQEADALLRGAGLELDPPGVAELADRTEGWPAGLYMAALSMRAGGAPGLPHPEAFAGDNRLVSEYFRSELLSRLPEAEARFLMHTSVLERMCGGLCDALLETTRSAATLESLERSNGFVVPLDQRSEWYRYHQLFGELLRSEVERREPEAVAVLNGRAMAWCVANGLPEAAVYYGRAAGETAAVAALIDRLTMGLYYGGRVETVERWLTWFDDDDLRRFPALVVYGAWFRVLSGRATEAERWLSLAEGAASAIPLSDGSVTIEPWVANLRACMMADGVERALADAERALEQFPVASDWRASALVIRGVAQALLGANDRARADLAAAIDTGLASGAAEDVYVAQAELALVAARRGAWDEARREAGRARAGVETAGLGDYSTSAIAHVAAARVAIHDGRHVDALAALTRAHRLRPLLDHSIPWFTVQVGLELTRGHLALGEVASARTVFAETEEVLERRPDLGSLVGDAQELRERLEATSGSAGSWAMSLTGAELRLLPYLATHLTFPEIGLRLFISRNTVKSEALAIYRKLSAASRGEAIERAIEVGLLDRSIYPAQENLTQEG